MPVIRTDAERRPDLFFWFGAIERIHIELWLSSAHLEVPGDLVDFWTQTGGSDFFESETIFRPTSITTPVPYFVSGDDIDAANHQRIRNGMSKSYLAFHDGTFLSAIRLADKKFVTLGEEPEETAEFSDFDDWYLRTVRELFATEYGLAPGSDD